MKYAIEQLRQQASIWFVSNKTRDIGEEFYNSANALERREEYNHCKQVVIKLEFIKFQLVAALSSWGDSYSQEKKMREQRLKDVEEAIKFIDK